MNDDELIDRLRETLREEASHVRAPSDAWERFQRRAPGAPGVAPARSRWLFAAPVAALGVAAAIVVAVVVSSNSTTKSGSRTEVATPAAGPATTAAAAASGAFAGSATTAPTTVAAPTAAAAQPVLSGFEPKSVTFVSPTEGFVLGGSAIAHTTDGGRTWSALSAPPDTNVTALRFANATDGWAWGPDLWATHDGGRTWHKLTVPGADGRVYDLEAAAGTVHMAVFEGQSFEVATAPAHSDAFTLSSAGASVQVGAGPVPTVQIVLQGKTGWMLEVDRTVIGGLRLVNGAWQPWTPPCVGTNGPAVLAASSPTELVAVCDQGVWGPATPMGERLWVSHDGGATFADVGASPLDRVQQVASPAAGVFVAAGAASIEASFDGGRTWSEVLKGSNQVSDLGFTTASQGVVVVRGAATAPGALEMTRDGGHTWTEVRFS